MTGLFCLCYVLSSDFNAIFKSVSEVIDRSTLVFPTFLQDWSRVLVPQSQPIRYKLKLSHLCFPAYLRLVTGITLKSHW